MAQTKIPEVVVVTGASAGVGRATVRAFARRGAHIGMIARGQDGLNAAKCEVEALGGRAIAISADVADADAIERAAEQIEAELGSIDVWVNNAMTSVFSRFLDLTPEEFRRVNEVTYLGYVYGTMSALRRMAARNRGTIVQVGSALAYRAIPLQSAYCGAKHAIEGFTESIRCELLHDNIDVHLTLVHLPAMNTPQFRWVKSKLPKKPQPVPPIYQPEIAADAIVWAAHHRRREMYVGGMTTAVILGNKVAPHLGDLYLAHNGFESQMIDEPEDPTRPNNLWQAVPGDHGAHGVFDERARSTSLQVWLTKHRKMIILCAGTVEAAAAAGFALREDQTERQRAKSRMARSDCNGDRRRLG